MGVSLSHYAYGFVTLGNGMDELSELYLNHEQIQEAYIVDCVSLMLLSKAYAEFAHVVEEQSGLYPLQNYLFWEIPIPLICFHRSMSALRRMRFGLTEGQMLLSTQRQLHSSCIWIQNTHADLRQLCNTCSTCKNFSCPSRKASALTLPHTYGAMQIFHIT